MSDQPYWNVVVSIDGEKVLSISPDELAGIPNIDDYREQVLKAADHLIAFIGRTAGEPFIVDDPEPPPPRPTPLPE